MQEVLLWASKRFEKFLNGFVEEVQAWLKVVLKAENGALLEEGKNDGGLARSFC